MALNINTSVWGTPENWNTNNATGNYIKYTPNRRTYNSMYENNLQQLNQDIDLSIAPWYINKNSVLRNIKGYYYYNDWKVDPDNPVASERGKGLLETFETTKPTYAPFIMSLHAESGETFTKQANKYTAYKRDGVTLTTPHVGNRYPITNFRYDKIKISPVIYATADDPSQGEAFSAIQNNLNPTGYPQYRTSRPYIVNVGFRIFADINGTWTQISATLDLDTILYGDSNASNWYSGQSDCHVLLNPYMNDYSTATNYNSWFFEWQSNNDMLVDGFCNGESIAKYSYYSFTSNTRDGVQCGLMPGFRFSERTEKNTGIASIMRGLPWRNVASLADYNDFINDLKRELAYIGLPFVIEQEDISQPFGSDDVYLPVFDEHRQTTGEYLNGIPSLTLPNSEWEWIYDLDVLPDPPPDEPEEDETDTGYLNNKQTYFYRYANPNAVYALDYANFKKFATDVNNLYSNDPTNLQQMQIDFKGVNPQDYIIGVYGIPFNVNYVVPSGPDDDIELGVLTLPTAKGKLVDTDTSLVRQLGHITIPKKYGDFRDYEPYTQIEVYLPFCGTAKLDPAQVVGHDLYLEYYYDILTLSCTACIYRDNQTLIHTSNGTIGASLPFTASAMGSYQNAMKQTENAIKRNEMNIGLGVASTVIGIAGVVGAPETGGASIALAGAAIAGMSAVYKGVQSANELNYELTHKQPQISQCSSPNGAVSQWIAQMVPVCFIKRAKMLPNYVQEIYAKTIGNSCCINDMIGNRSGLTVCSSIDTSGINKEVSTGVYISPTIDEVNMIKQYFSSGVIV